jgi:hypothetical protein
VVYSLAAIAAATGAAVATALHSAGAAVWQVTIVPPSTFAIFTVLYQLYDKLLWRWFPFSRLFRMPLFSGKWSGSLMRTGDDGVQEKRNIEILIRQTWTSISICLTGNTSDSKSVMASVDSECALPELTYQYISRKRDRAETSIGVTHLIMNGDQIRGYYFSELSKASPISLVRTIKK